MEKLVAKLASVAFVRKALDETIDLRAFAGKPTPRELIGICAIILSYLVCWPVIALLSAAAISYKRPLLLLIGGPVDYGLSHVIFLLGMYLAGARYSAIFLRWLTRAAMLKLLRCYPDAASRAGDRTAPG
ncbi:MAG: hypothetical protein ACP5IL_09350 [Syntrophobacteraceae bacterium]